MQRRHFLALSLATAAATPLPALAADPVGTGVLSVGGRRHEVRVFRTRTEGQYTLVIGRGDAALAYDVTPAPELIAEIARMERALSLTWAVEDTRIGMQLRRAGSGIVIRLEDGTEAEVESASPQFLGVLISLITAALPVILGTLLPVAVGTLALMLGFHGAYGVYLTIDQRRRYPSPIVERPELPGDIR